MAVDREALAHNEKPMALSFFPVGGEAVPQPFVTLTGEAVQITALKQAEAGDGLIVRLFNPTAQPQATTVSFAPCSREINLSPFEVRSYYVDLAESEWVETNLIEEPL
jgi:alpha-mannosidase